MKYETQVYINLAGEGKSNRSIARILGVDEKTVRRHLAEYRRDRVPVDLLDPYDFELEAPIEIVGPVMVTADFHAPLLSPAWVNHMLETAQREELKHLVIAGDLFNMEALARYEPAPSQKNGSTMFKSEINVARALMRVMLEVFDDITMIWGNHDHRFLRAINYKLQFRDAMRLLLGDDDGMEKIRISNLDHLWIRPYKDAPSYESWYVCHPENYSKVPLRVGRELSGIHRANVITAHSHNYAYGHAPDGKLRVVEAGGMFDRKLQAYLKRTATYPTHQNGYCWIDEGGYVLPFESTVRTIKEIG